MKDGRYVILVDKVFKRDEGGGRIQLYYSEDNGKTWSAPVETAARGIVPDQLLELASRPTFAGECASEFEISNFPRRKWDRLSILGSADRPVSTVLISCDRSPKHSSAESNPNLLPRSEYQVVQM